MKHPDEDIATEHSAEAKVQAIKEDTEQDEQNLQLD